jgi:hypothetical protein
MSQIERYILIGLATIFVVVFLRWLKRFLRRNEIQESFPYVHPFGKGSLSGKEVLGIELPVGDKVRVEVYSDNGKMVLFLFEEVLKQGSHQKGIDLSELPKGSYTLKITFSNQVTSRQIKIG